MLTELLKAAVKARTKAPLASPQAQRPGPGLLWRYAAAAHSHRRAWLCRAAWRELQVWLSGACACTTLACYSSFVPLWSDCIHNPSQKRAQNYVLCAHALSPHEQVTAEQFRVVFPFTPARWGWCVEREGWLGGLETITISTAWETRCVRFWQTRVFKRHGTYCATSSSSQMAHWDQNSKPFPAYLFKLSKYLTEWMSSGILKTILCRRKDTLEIGVFPHFIVLSRNGKCSLLVSLAVMWQGGQCQLITATDMTDLHFFLHTLPFGCSDLSPSSLVAWISPEGLNKFFL